MLIHFVTFLFGGANLASVKVGNHGTQQISRLKKNKKRHPWADSDCVQWCMTDERLKWLLCARVPGGMTYRQCLKYSDCEYGRLGQMFPQVGDRVIRWRSTAVLRILIPHLLLDRCPVLHSSAATRICVTPPILPQQVLWLARWRLWSPHGGWPTNAAGLTTDPCFLPRRQCPGGADYWLDRCFFLFLF